MGDLRNRPVTLKKKENKIVMSQAYDSKQEDISNKIIKMINI
jgi:hypothetical protein